MNLRKAAVLAGLAVFGSFGVQAVWADDLVSNLFEPAPDDYIKTRSYVGVLGTSPSIDRAEELNGTYAFYYPAANNEVNLIPSISRGFGFGGMVGYRTGAYAAEISYWKSWHESVWIDVYTTPGSPVTYFGNSSYQALSVDLKRYLLTKYPAQPYFGFGLSFPWVTSDNASTIDGISFSDSTLSGVGLNLTVGMEIYLGNELSIFGSVVQRWTGFNQVNGYSGKEAGFYLDGNPADLTNLEAGGLNFCVGGTIGFQ